MPFIAIKLNHETDTKTVYGKLLTIMYKLYGKESTATETIVLIFPDKVNPKKTINAGSNSGVFLWHRLRNCLKITYVFTLFS